MPASAPVLHLSCFVFCAVLISGEQASFRSLSFICYLSDFINRVEVESKVDALVEPCWKIATKTPETFTYQKVHLTCQIDYWPFFT